MLSNLNLKNARQKCNILSITLRSMMDTILTISTSLQNQLRDDNYCKRCERFQAQISTQKKRDKIKSRSLLVVDAFIWFPWAVQVENSGVE